MMECYFYFPRVGFVCNCVGETTGRVVGGASAMICPGCGVGIEEICRVSTSLMGSICPECIDQYCYENIGVLRPSMVDILLCSTISLGDLLILLRVGRVSQGLN